MNNKENIKEYTQNIHLSEDEKFSMLSHMRAHMDAHPIQAVPSPWYMHFVNKSFAYSTLGIVFMSIATTSVIAEGAIPGDTLYPIKININEPVVRALIVGETAKTEYSIKQTEKRLEELTQLVEEDKDQKENLDVIFEQIDEHTEQIETFIENTQASDPQTIALITAETKEVFTEHISLLETVLLTEDTTAPEQTPTSTQEEVISTEAPIESTSTEDAIATTSTENIDTIMIQTMQINSEAMSDTQATETEQVSEVQDSTLPIELDINEQEILERFRKFVE